MRIGMGWLGLGQDITFGLTNTGTPILTSGSTSLIDSSSVCMPQGYAGPLQAGQVYCTDTSTTAAGGAAATTPPAAVCPTGATCSIVPGISNTNIYLAIAAVIAGFIVMGAHK